jgi:EAL domain-containing protein (putative c-di-GMP-specific phosphodiesterase class I)
MVVAEGVEEEATLERLRALGCDMVQGFLVSQPVSAAQLTKWIRESPWARGNREPSQGLRRVV